MTPPETDPNIEQLHHLANIYRESEKETKLARQKLDRYIRQLKREGYPFSALAANSGLAQGTIQNIVAKDISD